MLADGPGRPNPRDLMATNGIDRIELHEDAAGNCAMSLRQQEPLRLPGCRLVQLLVLEGRRHAVDLGLAGMPQRRRPRAARSATGGTDVARRSRGPHGT